MCNSSSSTNVSANVTTPSPSGDEVFVGSTFASATPAAWKVSVNASLTNYLRDMYQYSTNSVGSVLTTAAAIAEFSDTVNVSAAGGPGVYSLSYIFSLDGTVMASDESDFYAELCVSLNLPQGSGTITSYCVQPGQTIPPSFMLTYSGLSFGTQITPTIKIEAHGGVNPLFPNQVGTAADTIVNASVDVDFASTVTLTSVLVTDSQGNAIPDVTFSSQSGAIYPLDSRNTVPEPTFLTPVGLIIFAVIRRLRSGNSAV